MRFLTTPLPGLLIVEQQPNFDERGYFARTFCQREFAAHKLHTDFVQANVSFNRRRGTLRGMHYQRPPHAEVKLVQCTRGAIFDAVVDLRRDSATRGQSFGLELRPESHRMLYIPRGMAHGFLTLCDDTEVTYLMGSFYEAAASAGFRWNDPAVTIEWPDRPQVISNRDALYEDLDLARVSQEFDEHAC